MSTWYTETFRGQFLWDLARCRAINSTEWETIAAKSDIVFSGGILKATGNFPEICYPRGTVKENLEGKNRKTFLDIFLYNARKQPTRRNFGKVILELHKDYEVIKTGLGAVYKVFSKCTNGLIPVKDDQIFEESQWVYKFIEHAMVTQSYAMKTQPMVMDKMIKRVKKELLVEASKWLYYARLFRNLITMRWHGASLKMSTGKKKLFNFAIDERFGLDHKWELYFDGWITYIAHPDFGKKNLIALTTVDLDRLQQMCVSRAMVEVHQATYCLTEGNNIGVYTAYKRRVLEILDEAIENVDNINCQFLCRDMKKAFNIYLSYLAGKLSDEGTRELLAEARNKGFDKTFRFDDYISLLRVMPMDLAQDFGRIYKLLPAPDYDIGESFVERQAQHLNPNQIHEVGGPNPCTLEEFRKYMRKLAIVTLILRNDKKGVGTLKSNREPTWWASYREKGIIPKGLDWVDEIDLTGVCEYKERTADSVTSWKDTACCEEDLDEAMEDKPPMYYKRNMLLRFLYDEMCPTHESASKNLTRQEHVHRVGVKMEAHKPVGRLFFIGNLSDRLVQSEMEENLHSIAQDAPGYSIGKSVDANTKKVMGMVAPSLEIGTKVYYLNFDISGWSPNMNGKIQRLSHNLWAEIFNNKNFKFAHLINENSIVILNKRGYKGAYVNPEANFEGYNGKEMTFLHCALMGYSVMRFQRLTGIKRGVSLCAYIDDGLATFVDKIENGPANFLTLTKVMIETYANLGFNLEKSKCYLSDTFAIFLNEIYFMGRHITYGLRAIMRIGTKVEEPHDTILDRVNRYMSGSQGAMKAGLDGMATYFVYLFYCAKMLREYNAHKYMDYKAAVLYLFTPKSLGGLGQTGFMGMITNYVSDPLAEGIMILQTMCMIYPDYKPKVLSLLRQKVAQKTLPGILNAPRTVKPAEYAIFEGRITNAVSRTLMKADLAARAKHLIRLAKYGDDDKVAEAVIEPNQILVEPLVLLIKEALPSHLIRALVKKFESSRTIQLLIGRSELKSVIRSNKLDALNSIKYFRKR